MKIRVIGGGLAGTEAALQLAKQGMKVDLYEMRPNKTTGAHHTDNLGELVCSNSLGSNDMEVASGLLKQELRILDSFLINIADKCRVPAGNALAVDRELFAQEITELINSNPNINVIREEITGIPQDVPTIIASGPLTSNALSQSISDFTGSNHLYFFDAIAPIVEKDSINFDIAFWASRYGKGEASYINCPMNEEEYNRFYEILTNSPKIELKEFEKDSKFFESCMPIEVMASRGKDTLRYGPMKPVGLIDPRTNQQHYAVVQLRQDNMSATLYNLVGFQTNLKWGAQKELIQSIPGLENASIIRFGVMHRNTFIYSPTVIESTLQTKLREDLYFAGQITGVEGYTESIATGLLAGINLGRFLNDKKPIQLDSVSMLGALCSYITFPEHKNFQPINSNWGILKPLDIDRKTQKNKKLRNKLFVDESLSYMRRLVSELI
ncbi:MAG: methylenetetrahydrofolate--tRNA-(uracil(54)-C(5))-methyltransferase (FADH(2)-oxidizing) TrmFO [Candidatus Melainabacteria bacterium GWF2_32_7]|nr:MAG: methylenetetrahydrofolate--tRNA-(uracil(54)-C(5))-methyltransferase (FADH(2)-oxidizing) TrmFO [Candidatus Melainabacteria bacterium GWF2_32_7]